jgi:O-palmitoleoyl-L-serine hydrolase
MQVWFRGKAIREAVQDDLLDKQGMNMATDVIVSGCSAGGLATYIGCDAWAERVQRDPPPEARADKLKVSCMPDSGMFFDYHSDRAWSDSGAPYWEIPPGYDEAMIWVCE